MYSKLISRSAILIGIVALWNVTGHAQWVQSQKQDDTANFLVASPPHIERYALTSGQWLPPVGLPSVYGAPTAFLVTSDRLYVAYGQTVKQYSLTGSNEVHLLNTADRVHGIFSDDGVIFINHTSGLYARFTSLNKANGAIIAQFENYIDSLYGAAIAPSINKLFGRTQGISPADIAYASYNADGTFITGGDSPHHGDYPWASRVWVFPGEAKVVDDSGTVYSTGNLNFVNSFGGTITDLDFYGTNIPIVLRSNTLVAYSNSLLPAGSRTLAFSPANIYISGTNVLTFTPDAARSNGIRVDAIPLDTLNPPVPGQPVDPHGLSYTPDNAFLDLDGTVYLLSKSHQSLFRWDTVDQRYLPTIPLVEVPSYAAYSADNHKIYVAYPSGLIQQIDLAGTNFLETPFANLPGMARGLATAGPYVFAADPSGAWATHYTFDPFGVRVSSKDWNYISAEFVWSEENQKMYYFRDGSPSDLVAEQINADGVTYPGLAPGEIGTYSDSPLHESLGWVYPIRVSPDGGLVVLGSGLMHNAVTLARLPTSLANSITDAAWVGGQLRTIRNIAGVMQFQQWNGPAFGQGLVRQVPGSAHRLFSLNGSSLLAVSILNGRPTFHVMDGDFNLLPPPVLEAPAGLRLAVASSSQINLSWNDVSGEESYSVERKTGQGGAWAEIGTTAMSTTAYADGSVSVGNVYFYRVIARNGAIASAPSAEVSASIVIPETPTNVTAIALSSSSIRVTWADVQNEASYLVERRIDIGSLWTVVATLNSDTTNYTDISLSPNTTYNYRLRATNGVGSSAYSAVTSATTDAVPPTTPYLGSVWASGPFSVVLYWSDSYYEDRYILERRTGAVGPWAYLTSLGRDITTYVDTTVSELTTYQYRLYATNTAGVSGYSEIRSVTTPEIPPPPIPWGLSARPFSISSVLITWPDVDLETGYRLERLSEAPESWALLAELPADTTSYLDTNLVEGVLYYYRIQAFNSHGSSFYSNEDDASPANIVTFLEDDFAPRPDPIYWASITGGVATNGGQGFRGNQALWFGGSGVRSATTVSLDLTRGGYFEFLVRGGNEAVDGDAFWNDCEPDEYVLLEYSIDGGIRWDVLEYLDTPTLTEWTPFSFEIPPDITTSQTRFRWRQVTHSGRALDTWALDDVRIQGIAPPLPEAPPFIISSPNSSTEIAVFWIEVEGATSYVLERRQGGGSWIPLATLASVNHFYVDDTALPSTAYSYRVHAVNAAGASPWSPVTTAITWSQLEEWLLVNFGDPDALNQTALVTPGADGTLPLLRFAFNLTASEPARTLVPGQSDSGFPAIWFDAARQRLCVEFVCRKASTRPGLTYGVEFCDNLPNWNSSGTVVNVTSLDSLWERVRYEDTVTASQASARFGRVTVRPQ